MGATLTLNRVDGNLLIAFTAVFVGVVTERIWRIACVLVSYFSKRIVRDHATSKSFGHFRSAQTNNIGLDTDVGDSRIFYRCYSSSEPRDALYHQQQAILRNSTCESRWPQSLRSCPAFQARLGLAACFATRHA